MEVVRTIKLSGPLAAEFGHVHRFAVNSAAEAIRALCSMVPGFERFLMEAKDRGLEFAVLYDRDNLSEDQLDSPMGRTRELRIVPVVVGSKKGGVLQTIVGAVLVVAGYFVTGLTYGWAAPVGMAMVNAGIGMMVGGVIQMLSPTPKRQSSDKKDDRTSYVFNGAVNVQAQGASVPVLYGELIVGSVVVSAGISSIDNYVVPSSPSHYTSGSASSGGSFYGDVNENYRNVER